MTAASTSCVKAGCQIRWIDMLPQQQKTATEHNLENAA